MSEKEIYEVINRVNSMILNNENKENALAYINKIGEEIIKLPIYREYRDTIMLYEKTYNEYLFANNKKKEE